MKAHAKFLGPVHITYHYMRAANDLARLHFSIVSPEPLLSRLKKEGMKMKAQAKFLGPVHITYQICEQRMIWRGCTLA